jgi:hypothetical protein
VSITCRASLDGGAPQAITAAPTVILQGTCAANRGVRLRRLFMQSNAYSTFNPDNTLIANQQSVQVSLGTYSAGTAGGSTPVAYPINEALLASYAPSTAFKAITTTMGTPPFFPISSWSWLLVNAFDVTFSTSGSGNLQGGGEPPMPGDGFKASAIFAFILAQGPAKAFGLTGFLEYDELT